VEAFRITTEFEESRCRKVHVTTCLGDSLRGPGYGGVWLAEHEGLIGPEAHAEESLEERSYRRQKMLQRDERRVGQP
jgi:hypothetical protein